MTNLLLPSQTAGFVRVEGRFYRSVDARFPAAALDGSRAPGRYSSAEERALYLSASPEGVDAAMLAHHRPDGPVRTVVSLQVEADRLFDLRDAERCAAVGVCLADATGPWQDIVAAGGAPPSWQVARRLREIGAHGLIDPSRKAPGLWHLVLFGWNREGWPTITVL